MSRHTVMQDLARRALMHFEAGTTDQAPGTMTLPVAAYLDGERFTRERDRVFKCLPLAMALSLELPDPGDYKAMTELETPLLLVRGEDGVARAFLNVCRHRGARLCVDGTSSARVFSCPYHAWVYDLQGRLTGQYGAETFGDIDKSSHGLLEVPCWERAGLIWVVLSGKPVDIDAWLGEFAAELESLELANWYLHEQRRLPGPGWKVTMDGYLEAYHHNLVHQKTVGQHTVGNLLVLDTYGPHQRLTFGRKSLGELIGQAEEDWQPGEHIRLIHSGFPNLSVSGILGDHCLVSQIFPGPQPDTTITVQSILAAREPQTDAEQAVTKAFSDMVLEAVQIEDYGIGQGIQSNLHAVADSHFVLGRNEPAVQNYHRWVEHFMNQPLDDQEGGQCQ